MFRQFAYKASLKLCVVVLTNSPSPGAKQGGRGGGMHRHKTVTAWADSMPKPTSAAQQRRLRDRQDKRNQSIYLVYKLSNGLKPSVPTD